MTELLPLLLGVLLAQAAPGPNLMAVSSIALGSGRKAGILTAAGVATGVFIWAIMFTFGIGAVLKYFPQLITILKLLGGGYLLYLGIKALKTALRRPVANLKSPGVRSTGIKAYRTGILVVLTNPKAALMWVAVSAFLATLNLTSTQFLATGFCVSLSAMAIYGTYAVLFSTGIAMRTYRRFSHYIEAAFGTVFGALGVKLLADGIKELRA